MSTLTKLTRASLLLAAVFTTAQTIKSSNISAGGYNVKVSAGDKVLSDSTPFTLASNHTNRKPVTYARLSVRDAASGFPTSYNQSQ